MRLSARTKSSPLSGAGGRGEVYKARDTRLNRIVAIKVLPDRYRKDPDRQRRLEREAKAIAALAHPHICTLHDVGQYESGDFLVMEYLEGETVASRLPIVSVSFDWLVSKCLAKDPDERWQSASDLADELRWIARGEGEHAAALTRLHQRREGRSVAMAVAVLLAAALARVTAWEGRDQLRYSAGQVRYQKVMSRW